VLLENKTALIYGAGGAIGGAVARRFAREGAKVFLAGRTLASVEAVAKEIAAEGGFAEAAQVDAVDETSVERHVAAVAEGAGRIDISFNAIGVPQAGLQGKPLVELAPDKFALPIATYAMSHFLTARSAARQMVEAGSGVILTLTAAPARAAGRGCQRGRVRGIRSRERDDGNGRQSEWRLACGLTSSRIGTFRAGGSDFTPPARLYRSE
jgi:NAD(P)-dependent dehydrogenase (short-subunit alcohol dehydrogenase family)